MSSATPATSSRSDFAWGFPASSTSLPPTDSSAFSLQQPQPLRHRAVKTGTRRADRINQAARSGAGAPPSLNSSEVSGRAWVGHHASNVAAFDYNPRHRRQLSHVSILIRGEKGRQEMKQRIRYEKRDSPLAAAALDRGRRPGDSAALPVPGLTGTVTSVRVPRFRGPEPPLS